MASPTVVGSVDTGVVSGAQTSLTVSHTLSAGQNLAVIVIVGAASGATCTWNSTSMTAFGAGYGVNSEVITMFYISGVSAGTANAVASFTSTNRAMMQVITFQDVDPTVIDGTQGTQSGVSTTPSVTMTTGTDNSAVVMVVGNDPKTVTCTFPGGETLKGQITNTTNNDQCTSATLDGGKTAHGSTTMTATLGGTGGSWDAIVNAIKYKAPTATSSFNNKRQIIGVGM